MYQAPTVKSDAGDTVMNTLDNVPASRSLHLSGRGCVLVTIPFVCMAKSRKCIASICDSSIEGRIQVLGNLLNLPVG